MKKIVYLICFSIFVSILSCEESEETNTIDITTEDLETTVELPINQDEIGSILAFTKEKSFPKVTIISQTPAGAISINEKGEFAVANPIYFDQDLNGVDKITGVVTVEGNPEDVNFTINLSYRDTDGDGVIDYIDEAIESPCLPMQQPGYQGYDKTNRIWLAADCDGDGSNNSNELKENTDPYVPCINNVNVSIWNGNVKMQDYYYADSNGDEIDFTNLSEQERIDIEKGDSYEEFESAIVAKTTISCRSLRLRGDWLNFLVDECLDNEIDFTNLVFTPDSEGAQTGTVFIADQYFIENCDTFFRITGRGYYDETTQTIRLKFGIYDTSFIENRIPDIDNDPDDFDWYGWIFITPVAQ